MKELSSQILRILKNPTVKGLDIEWSKLSRKKLVKTTLEKATHFRLMHGRGKTRGALVVQAFPKNFKSDAAKIKYAEAFLQKWAKAAYKNLGYKIPKKAVKELRKPVQTSSSSLRKTASRPAPAKSRKTSKVPTPVPSKKPSRLTLKTRLTSLTPSEEKLSQTKRLEILLKRSGIKPALRKQILASRSLSKDVLAYIHDLSSLLAGLKKLARKKGLTKIQLAKVKKAQDLVERVALEQKAYFAKAQELFRKEKQQEKIKGLFRNREEFEEDLKTQEMEQKLSKKKSFGTPEIKRLWTISEKLLKKREAIEDKYLKANTVFRLEKEGPRKRKLDQIAENLFQQIEPAHDAYLDARDAYLKEVKKRSRRIKELYEEEQEEIADKERLQKMGEISQMKLKSEDPKTILSNFPESRSEITRKLAGKGITIEKDIYTFLPDPETLELLKLDYKNPFEDEKEEPEAWCKRVSFTTPGEFFNNFARVIEKALIQSAERVGLPGMYLVRIFTVEEALNGKIRPSGYIHWRGRFRAKNFKDLKERALETIEGLRLSAQTYSHRQFVETLLVRGFSIERVLSVSDL